MVDGVQYIWREPAVLTLMVLGLLPFLLGQPYQSMLPVFAKDVLDIGPQGLGLLTTSAATGGLLGAFITASFGDFRKKGLVMLVGLISFALLLVAFALSQSPLLSAAILFLVGAANQVYQTINQTLIQFIVPSEYRGRVLGVHQLDRGFIPVGSFVAGTLAEYNGAPFATSLMAGLLAASGAVVLLCSSRMRRLE